MLGPKTIAIILGGGAGTRLYPLTGHRSKPAVPIAGKFRLIDIPISNCLNSNIRRMFVLTQYNSASLNRHIKNTFNFDIFSDAFVDILAAEQTKQNMGWFQGTADAVRQSVSHLENFDFDYILILSGDQLYQMNFEGILNFHAGQKAQITVATIPVDAQDAPGFGIMKVDASGLVNNFIEKPAKDILNQWTSAVPSEYSNQGKHYLASMGIYVFSRGVLSRLFDENPQSVDFGKELIPYAVNHSDYKVCSFPFGGYWTDIGTIRSFFEANLRLTEILPEFNLYDNINKTFTHARMLSPSKFFGANVSQALISEGCLIHAEKIAHSIIGIRSRIGRGTTIEDSILMGIDFYQTLKELELNPNIKLLGIGEGCYLKNVIVDKNVRIGNNCRIVGSIEMEDVETDEYCVRDGIVVIKKGASIEDNSMIGL